MPRTAFVTGATGFVGINLIEALCQKGWRVTALHRRESDLTYLNSFDLNQAVGDVLDYHSIEQGMPAKVDVVFHLAASTNMWSKHNKQQYRINVNGTQNVVKAALKKHAGRFIHTSSIAAFGIHESIINESTPSNALSSGINYVSTKYLAEQEIRSGLEKGLDAVILNPAHIVGPYDTHNWIQVFQAINQEKLPGIPPGSGMFCYVKDVVEAHITAVDKGASGENYLLGGAEASIKTFTNEIEALMGKKISAKANSKMLLMLACYGMMFISLFTKKEPLLTPEKVKLVSEHLLCDDSKARAVLGFSPTPLKQVVSATYSWLKAEGHLK